MPEIESFSNKQFLTVQGDWLLQANAWAATKTSAIHLMYETMTGSQNFSFEDVMKLDRPQARRVYQC